MKAACDLFKVGSRRTHEVSPRRERPILLQTLPPFAPRLLCSPNCLLTALGIYPQVPEPYYPLEAAGPEGATGLALPCHCLET